MENSNLPLRYWLSVIAYLSHARGKVSALQIQKELQHNRYEPILRMVTRIKGMPESDCLRQRILHFLTTEAGYASHW